MAPVARGPKVFERWLPALAASILLSAQAAQAALVDRVLVIRNLNSQVSRAVADDYMARRGATHVLDVRVPDASIGIAYETIAYKDFEVLFEKPLRAYLAAHAGIDFILMTKGVPIRLMGAQNLLSSVDSYVAALDYERIPGAIRVESADPSFGPYGFHGTSWACRYWNSRKPFTHAEFGGYLVTRLDGYTQEEAIGLTTLALAAEANVRRSAPPSGPILLDQDPDYGVGDPSRQPYSILRANPPMNDTIRIDHESEWKDWNADLALAADSLRAHRVPCILDATETFRGYLDGLMGYASWGSNDRHYNGYAYCSLHFAPGALAETAVSTSGRTFLPTDGGQSLVASLVHSGVSGVKGYADEPLLQAIASPSILFSRYTSGWTLAESYYAASNEVGWEDIVIGDPILRAYPYDAPEEPAYSAEDPSGQTTRIRTSAASSPDRNRVARRSRKAVLALERPGTDSPPVSVLGRALR